MEKNDEKKFYELMHDMAQLFDDDSGLMAREVYYKYLKTIPFGYIEWAIESIIESKRDKSFPSLAEISEEAWGFWRMFPNKYKEK